MQCACKMFYKLYQPNFNKPVPNNMRPTGLNDHLNIRDSTLTSSEGRGWTIYQYFDTYQYFVSRYAFQYRYSNIATT